jgi:site-specific recombinase XerD
MDLRELQSFALELKAEGKSASTVDSYVRDTRKFLQFLEKHRISPLKVEHDYIASFKDTIPSENSYRRGLIALRRFYDHLHQEGRIQENPLKGIAIPKRNEALPKPITPEDLSTILTRLEGIQDRFIHLRNLVIVKLLALEGLKATEIIELRHSGFALGRLRIPGVKARTIVPHPTTIDTLRSYSTEWTHFLREHGIRTPYMFISFHGREGVLEQMTRHGLKFIIYEIGEWVAMSHLNTEILRHHAIEYQKGQGKSIEQIMQHFGLRRAGNIKKHFPYEPQSE